MDEYVYIYRISCGETCYVGQSNRKTGRVYGRLEEHVKVGWKMWSKAGESKVLKELFRTHNLKDIKFELYDKSTNYGISIKDYNKFLKLFSPEPNTEYTYEKLSQEMRIDIAEILHIAYAGLYFKTLGNLSVGGQHYAWYFIKSSQIAFTRRFSPNNFLGLMATKRQLEESLKELSIKQYQLNIIENKAQLLAIIKEHWNKRKKSPTLNWKEFSNMLNKHYPAFSTLLEGSVNKFLYNFQTAWKALKLSWNVDVNLNPKLLLKEITKQLGEVLSFETKKNNIKDTFEIPVNQFIYANLDFKNTKWEKKDLGFIGQLQINGGDTEIIQNFLKKWTSNLFKYMYDKAKNENFYQDLYDERSQKFRIVYNESSNYAILSRGKYKKYRSLNYRVQRAYIDKGLEMPFIEKNWNIFYDEEMNLLMQRLPFSYFVYNRRIYAFHITNPTTIELTDDDAQNAVILTQVNSVGSFDNPSDYTQITIY